MPYEHASEQWTATFKILNMIVTNTFRVYPSLRDLIAYPLLRNLKAAIGGKQIGNKKNFPQRQYTPPV